MANSIDFGLASIMQIGAGKNTRFGLENPLDSTLRGGTFAAIPTYKLVVIVGFSVLDPVRRPA